MLRCGYGQVISGQDTFSLSEEASLFRGIGAMKRAMQMEELALTNA